MPQIFRPRHNTLAPLSLLALVVVLGGGIGLVMAVERSPYKTREGEVLEQPIPFSHDHHTAAMGIDCRYCHTSVERAASAGLPPTETCMNCHKIIWQDSPMLEPVRASYRSGEPIQWNRVHDLPDYVYFDHSIHVAKGVGCATCHGPVNEMPLLARGASLQMAWCLDCHRNPERYVRPPEEVFNMEWTPGEDPGYEERLREIADYRRLSSCSTCHR